MKKYLTFTKAAFLNVFSYRFAIFGWITGEIAITLITCLLWKAIFEASKEALYNGFTLEGLITYTIVARITSQLIFSTVSFWQFADDIREGKIAINLIKPISYRLALFFSTIGSFIVQITIIMLPLFIGGYVLLYLTIGVQIPNIINILLFIVSAFLGTILIDSFDFFFGQAAFFTGALFGLSQIKYIIIAFLSGALIPIAFFPEWSLKILNYLPFSSMLSVPINILLGNLVMFEIIKALAFQVVWIIIINIICNITYKRAVKHVVSYGG